MLVGLSMGVFRLVRVAVRVADCQEEYAECGLSVPYVRKNEP